MPETPQTLAGDLDEGKTRFRFPRLPIFFCGGVILEGDGLKCPSLRDYLIRLKKIEGALPDKVVLAERANQLFLKTDYRTLIEFEEDIALLSGLIVLIAESPGSLAELGSFEANNNIRRRLRVIIQDCYEDSASFIRNGPIEQLIGDNEDSVAFYPWTTSASGMLVKSSIAGEVQGIIDYITEEHLSRPKTQFLKVKHARKRFLLYLYWIVHLCGGRPPSALYEIVRTIFPGAKDAAIRNGLFCLELLGWIGRVRYGTKEYFFALHDDDPLTYRFKPTAVNKNATARKQEAFEWIDKTYPVEHRAKRRILAKRRELLS